MILAKYISNMMMYVDRVLLFVMSTQWHMQTVSCQPVECK
jgi:hypothetical protein